MRRARRLLPALILVLVAVAIFGAFVATDDEALGLRGDLLGLAVLRAELAVRALGRVVLHAVRLAVAAPPHVVARHRGAVVPHLAAAALRDHGGDPPEPARLVTAIILVLAAASALLMAALYHQGGDASRAYYGTDTRAQALLVGAALAVLFTMRVGAAHACRRTRCMQVRRRARRASSSPGSWSSSRSAGRRSTAAGSRSSPSRRPRSSPGR